MLYQNKKVKFSFYQQIKVYIYLFILIKFILIKFITYQVKKPKYLHFLLKLLFEL